MDNALRKFIEDMPKVELHLHIEGSLEPELAFKLAQKNGVTLYKDKEKTIPFESAEELKAAYKFDNLQEFLDLYYRGMSSLKTEQDFYDMTMAYLTKAKSQNVTHTEIFFDPQQHMENGIAFETALNGIHRALKDGEEMGVTSKLIMSFLRHLPETAPEGVERAYKDAFETLELAKQHLDKIDGFGLDSSEAPFPPAIFERVYEEARKTGKPVMAHAGEEGPWEYVRDALDILKVDRIDHGNHCLDNEALVQRLVDEKMGLTVCPYSNLRLNHTTDFATDTKLTDMKQHPIKKMLDLGLKASIHSDDPAYFRTDEGKGGYMTENYLAVAEALNLSRDDIVTLARNAIETSFMSPEQKTAKTQELDAYTQRADVFQKYVNQVGGEQARTA